MELCCQLITQLLQITATFLNLTIAALVQNVCFMYLTAVSTSEKMRSIHMNPTDLLLYCVIFKQMFSETVLRDNRSHGGVHVYIRKNMFWLTVSFFFVKYCVDVTSFAELKCTHSHTYHHYKIFPLIMYTDTHILRI